MIQDKNLPEPTKFLFYQTEDGQTRLEVAFRGETCLLSLNQLAELFQRDKSVISRHIKNIFDEGELARESVVANFETTATEGRSTGISKILKVMKGNGSPPPEFKTNDDRSYFLIRLPVHPEADLGDSVEAEGLEKTPVETPDQILQMLDEKPEMTLAEVASKIGKSLRAVERASSKLVKAGRLRFVGPKKGGHWEVKEKS